MSASVLMNVPADTLLAVFALTAEGTTIQIAQEKVIAQEAKLREELKKAGLPAHLVESEFISQNRLYEFKLEPDLAREVLAGFETKRNVIVRVPKTTGLDRVIQAAGLADVFDLIRVDYLVTDLQGIRDRLRIEASAALRRKLESYRKGLGMPRLAVKQVLSESFAAYYPTESYAAYDASEGENITRGFAGMRQTTIFARKPKTFYYQPLNGKLFDAVVSPLVTLPVVQFTLNLTARAEPERPPQPAPKPKRKQKPGGIA